MVPPEKEDQSKQKPGAAPAFSVNEEQFVARLISMSALGFSVTTFDLRMVAKQYLDKIGKKVRCFKFNLPEHDRAESFMKHHKTVLSQQMSKKYKLCQSCYKWGGQLLFFDNLE